MRQEKYNVQKVSKVISLIKVRVSDHLHLKSSQASKSLYKIKKSVFSSNAQKMYQLMSKQ